MTIAALAATSSYARWILCDDHATKILGELSWSDSQSTGLSNELMPSFQKLLSQAGVSRQELTRLFVVSGPGAFTGLRMSSAFMQGLSRALQIPCMGIPSFDLVGEPFCIPLRHQLAKNLSLSELKNAGIELLELQSKEESLSVLEPQKTQIVLGLKDCPDWPSPAQLLKGVQTGLQQRAGKPIKIIYGLEPKISGIRTKP